MSAKILVIDDEPNLRTMIKLALVHAGYEVDTANNASEGLLKFGDGRLWDVVLLDNRMPGMSGIEAQKEIFRRSSEARLILITAFGSIDLALESMQQGASDFLRKPFTPETLRNAVKTCLDRPVQKLSAVPVGLACREFTRTTINGYSFELDTLDQEEFSGDLTYTFQVSLAGSKMQKVKVLLHAYVMELAKAYSDTEEVPGGNRFWQAMCEEELADFLWRNAELPAGTHLEIDDLTPCLKKWIDSVLTLHLID